MTACAFGCRTPDKTPEPAVDGWNVCPACSARIAQLLHDLERTYTAATHIDQMIPKGDPSAPVVARSAGSKSPTVDTILVHTDVRSVTEPGEAPAALPWANDLANEAREVLGLPAPGTRLTMTRELETVRAAWAWLMGHESIVDLFKEAQRVLRSLERVHGSAPKMMTAGKCPILQLAIPLTDGTVLQIACGATLSFYVDARAIRCGNCRTVWPKARWRELGDDWADYATLSRDLGVPAGTLRYWASEDAWERQGREGLKRVLVSRMDALDSYTRRRGPLLGEVS
jgi:hypothetical protein